jgi:hypothetical protein
MVNPYTIPIQGDLSRQDVVVLVELCADRRVVEFGVGGSTLILARCASSLLSFDTDATWIKRTARRLTRIDDKTTEPVLVHERGIPVDIPDCDVLFLDGLGDHRWQWLKFFPKCRTLLCHDSLGDTGQGPTLYHIMAELFKDPALVSLLERADFHYKNSNMVVVYRRDQPLHYAPEPFRSLC